MPRGARDSLGGSCYHVLNRGNGRRTGFREDCEFEAFLGLLVEAGERVPVRLLAHGLVRHHFHLLLWPRRDGELSAFLSAFSGKRQCLDNGHQQARIQSFHARRKKQ